MRSSQPLPLARRDRFDEFPDPEGIAGAVIPEYAATACATELWLGFLAECVAPEPWRSFCSSELREAAVSSLAGPTPLALALALLL